MLYIRVVVQRRTHVSFMPHLSLWFQGSTAPELTETCFRTSLLQVEQRAIRGQLPVRGPVAGTFPWSSAVKALAAFFVKVKLLGATPTIDPAILEGLRGGRGTAASSLDGALYKQPSWLVDMFGVDSRGRSLINRVIRRVNPGLKRVGPVQIFLNEDFIPLDRIHIFVDGKELISGEDLHTLLSNLEKQSVATLTSAIEVSGFEAPLVGRKDKRAGRGVAADAHGRALEMALDLVRMPSRSNMVIRPFESDAELYDLWLIDSKAYGSYSIPFEILRQWWQTWPMGLTACFVDGHPYGTLGMWPLPRDWVSKFKEGLVRERDLNAEVLGASCKSGSDVWYVSGFLMAKELQQSKALKALLEGGVSAWLNTEKVRYPVEILALGTTPAGVSLLRRFGFAEIRQSLAMADSMPLYGLTCFSREQLVDYLSNRGLRVDCRPDSNQPRNRSDAEKFV